MQERAPKIIFVSILFIIATTVMSQFEVRLTGIYAAYQKYYEQILNGQMPDFSLYFSYFNPAGAVLSLLLYLLQPVIEIGMVSYCLKTTRGAVGDYKDLLDGFLFFGKILLIFIITTVLTFLWSLLFLFPGIAAHYRYRQSYYILLDDPDKSALQCIRESKRIMRGNKVDLFLLDFSFIGWYLLDFLVVFLIPSPIPLPIVYIWLNPYMGLSRAAFYNQLLSRLAV